MITIQGAIEKNCDSNIGKNEWLDGTLIISYFGGSNNIFADCRLGDRGSRKTLWCFQIFYVKHSRELFKYM